MKKIVLIISLAFCFNLFAQKTIPSDSIKEYVKFIEGNDFLSPKEYVFNLFKKNEIVILTERHHADIKQYELILDILKDERFNGNIYTEVGVYNSAKSINEFLKKENLTAQEKEKELLNIYRDLDFYLIWDKYNFYYLLSSIYEINQRKELKDKINLIPLDISFDWNAIKSHEQYEMFDNYLNTNDLDRDLLMGRHFLETYEKFKKEQPNKAKALVILNIYHGYTRIPKNLKLPTEPYIYSAAEYIFKTYPNTTKNVLLNSYIFDPKPSLVANGKWDASFKITGNQNFGFDLKNTPFGKTNFDMYSFGENYESVNFEYIFDGFIFYYPIEKFKLAWGIPNIYTNEKTEQFFERVSIIEGKSLENVKEDKDTKDYLKKINILRYEKVKEIELFNTQMNRWLSQKKKN